MVVRQSRTGTEPAPVCAGFTARHYVEKLGIKWTSHYFVPLLQQRIHKFCGEQRVPMTLRNLKPEKTPPSL